MYNKTVHNFETESLKAHVSMGTRQYCHSDYDMRDKAAQCYRDGITRIEVTTKLRDQDESNEFFETDVTAKIANVSKTIDDLMRNVNKLGLCYKVSLKNYLNLMFGPDGFQRTVLVHHPQVSGVIYGFNSATYKFVGIW